MRGLTEKLLAYLNRVWSRDPVDVLAIRLVCDGSDLTWQILNNILTTAPVGGTSAPLTIDLSQYTIANLAAFLAAQTGYSVLYTDTDTVEYLSAFCLRDQAGNVNVSNGDHIYAATNPTFIVLGAFARELLAAKAAIVQMLLQIPTAAGEWLDFHGSYYAVPRNLGEADPAYAARIVPQVLLPKGNNVAIANVITETFGQPVQVVDVLDYTNAEPKHDSSFAHDGTKYHTNTGAAPIYGLFDVSIGQDILGSDNPLPTAALRAVIETVRDAGTQLRSIVGTPSAVSDQAPFPASDAATMTITRQVYHNELYYHDGNPNYSGAIQSTETLMDVSSTVPVAYPDLLSTDFGAGLT